MKTRLRRYIFCITILAGIFFIEKANAQTPTFTYLSGGLNATDPVVGQSQRALYGFSVAVNTGSLTFQQFTIGWQTGTVQNTLCNGTLYRASTNTYNSGSPGTPVGTVTFSGSNIIISNLTETVTSGTPRYYFLVADIAGTGGSNMFVNNASNFALDINGTNYGWTGGTYKYYNYTTGTAYPFRVDYAPTGLTSTATSFTAGGSTGAVLGFGIVSNSTLNVSQININSNLTTLSDYFSGFTLQTTGTTASYTGATAVTATVTMSGSYVNIAITGTNLQASTTKRYYWLVGTLKASITGSRPASVQFNLSAGQSSAAFTAGSTYNTHTVFGPTYSINYSNVTVANLTGGVASGTVTAATTDVVLFGFSVTSSAATTFSDYNINATNTPGTYFRNVRLYTCTGSTYSVGTRTIVPGTVTFNGSYANCSSIAQSFTAGQTKYYFLVADNYGGATSATLGFRFVNGQSTSAIVQTSPAASTYNAFAVTGNVLTMPTPTLIIGSLNNVANGITSTISPGDLQKAFFGFTVTAVGTVTVNQVNVDFPAGSNGTYFANARLYYSSADNVYGPDADDNSISTGALNSGNVNFGTVGVTLTNETRNYFLVADVNTFNNSSTPASVQFRFANGQGQAAFIQSSPYTTYNTYTNNGLSLTMPSNTDWIWTGNDSTDPADNGNWSNFQVPSGSSNFIIPGGRARYPVLANTTTSGIFRFTGTGGSFTIATGIVLSPTTITVAAEGSGTLNGPGTVSSSSAMTVNTGATLNLGTIIALTGTGGTLTNAGTINLTGTGTITTGNATATTASSNTGTINLNGSAGLSFTGAFSNAGTISKSGASNVTLANTTGFTNAATGIITNTGSGNLIIDNSAGNIVNSGTINKTSTGALTLSDAVTNNSTGIISQDGTTGALTFSSTVANSGDIRLTTAGPLTITGALTNNSGADLLHSGSGTFTLTAAPTLNSGSIITQSGSGLMTFSSGTALAQAGTITQSGSGTITFGAGTLTNSGTMTQSGSGIINFPADVTNSTGATIDFSTGTGTVNFTKSGTQTITNNSTNEVDFDNVTFSNGTTKALAGTGGFGVSTNGVLTLGANMTLTAGTAKLTLYSGATSTASVAAIPSTSSITGTVTTQRYFTGGTTASRAYRLISSPVNTNTVTNNSGATATYNLTGLSYPTSQLYTGGPGGNTNGFTFANAATSTVFLYREDVTPNGNSFNNGNYKGITKLNANPFSVATLAGTYSWYAGNGLMIYYAGSTSGTNFSTVKTPDNIAASFTGTLNQGTIPVRLWFTPSVTTLSYTAATPISDRGYTLVGNPYASTIDWDTFSKTDANAGVYAVNLDSTIYVYNYLSKNYGAYQKNINGTGTNNASRYIASGQGFFVKATATGATLTFKEAAKVSVQPNSLGTTKLLMGLPVAVAKQQLLRVKLAQDDVNTDDIMVLFENDATDTYELEKDVDDIAGIGNIVSLSSYSKNDKKALAINHMHSIDSATRIKLLVRSTVTGVDTLKITGVSSLDNRYDLYLLDHYKKDSVLISADKDYVFNINLADTASFGSSRFELAFSKDATYTKYKLLDFAARKVATGVQLTWKVENEGNFTGFTVQRADGSQKFITFQALHSLQSDGKATYTYLDNAPLSTIGKYRLMQNDAFDRISYSEIITVSNDAPITTDPITLYPNPVVSQLQINFNTTFTGNKVHLMMMNTSGQVFLNKDISPESINQNVSYLLPGSYIVELSDPTTKKVIGRKKFIKL